MAANNLFSDDGGDILFWANVFRRHMSFHHHAAEIGGIRMTKLLHFFKTHPRFNKTWNITNCAVFEKALLVTFPSVHVVAGNGSPGYYVGLHFSPPSSQQLWTPDETYLKVQISRI